MDKATIYFSNGETLTLQEGDSINPIVKSDSVEKFASLSNRVMIDSHIHNGLIPSIMDALCYCNFFYINDNYNITYGTNSIVKIEIP